MKRQKILEITENSAMLVPELVSKFMADMQKKGISFAIDDFGTGYSNLSQLSQLPFDVFKIDRSFVDLLTDENIEHGRIIVKTILAMANSLNYETVAEGVETAEQLEFMARFGCTFAQGYYFAKPMPEPELLEWLSEWDAAGKQKIEKIMNRSAA